MKKKYSRNVWTVIRQFKNVIDYRYGVNCYGDVIDLDTMTIMHKKIANKKHHPYYAVYLKRNDGTSEWYLVHQLVATYFVKIPEHLYGNTDIVPDHLDNNGLNNFYKNLEWKTRSENIKSAYINGYINNSCENSKSTDICNADVHKICQLLEDELDYDEILDMMGYPNTKKYRTLLVRIKNKIAWTDISKQYNIKNDRVKYTKSQLDTLSKLREILDLHHRGFTTRQIFDIVYKGYNCNKDTKMNIIRRVCKHEIFKSEIRDILQDERSTTIES